MFLTELQPFAKECIAQPVAFLGGVVSGFLKLSLSEDPLKTWLQKQGLTDISPAASSSNNNKPQSISID
jgi:hypothetical protein